MRVFSSLGLGIVLFCAAIPAGAQTPTSKPKDGQTPAGSDDLAAIRKGASEFEAAFNAGNAKDVAALWTEDGDYTDETGEVFSGREAIEKEYAAILGANPGGKMHILIDSLRLLSDSAAIEDGHAHVDSDSTGPPAIGKYTVVHVKVNGKWLMSTVRDSRIELPSSYRKIDDLEWLIGTWVGEEQGAKIELVCRWVVNKSFVECIHTVTETDGTTSSAVQLIGFNPQGGHVQSWNFSSDGFAVGVWSPRANGWSAEIQGTNGKGQSTRAINLLTALDDDTYAWQSIQRTAGDQLLADTEEVVFKRQPK
jgi:uncharacterized protein (TIGR02246 family)